MKATEQYFPVMPFGFSVTFKINSVFSIPNYGTIKIIEGENDLNTERCT